MWVDKRRFANCGDTTITVSELGCDSELTRWKGVNGLIWVIDSNDPARIEESREEFMKVLNDESVPRGIPLLVLANKQDLPQAISTSKVVELLGLHSLRGHKWHVQGKHFFVIAKVCSL